MTIAITRITQDNVAHFEVALRQRDGIRMMARLPLDSDSFWLLFALRDEQPAGFASVVLIPKADARRGFLFVDELEVLPAFPRQGVATILLTYIEQIARELGLAGVRLLVRPENEAAQVLYRRFGFALSETVFGQKDVV